MIKKKVLMVISNYYPGYKLGGILRSVSNTVEALKNDIDFYIICGNTDKGDKIPYQGIPTGVWLNRNGHNIKYVKFNFLLPFEILKTLNENYFDVVHLNSFFDTSLTLKFLIAIRLLRRKNQRIIISPRGEFIDGSLKIKYFKKVLYIYLTKYLGLYGGINWHAASRYEAQKITDIFKNSKIRIAPDIFIPMIKSYPHPSEDSFKIIFLSRISIEKNLDFALRCLKNVSKNITFNIYGPIENEDYWAKCREVMQTLPENITCSYKGDIKNPNQVYAKFANHHLFLFPTRSESYGQVIAESLSVGTKVLISNTTPWQDLESNHLGWVLELSIEKFSRKIDEIVSNYYATNYCDDRDQTISRFYKFIELDKVRLQNINVYE